MDPHPNMTPEDWGTGCNGLPIETVHHWCPECDMPRPCFVVSLTAIECSECGEPIPTPLPEN